MASSPADTHVPLSSQATTPRPGRSLLEAHNNNSTEKAASDSDYQLLNQRATGAYNQGNRSTSRRKLWAILGAILGAIVVLGIGLGVGLGVGLSKNHDDNDSSGSQGSPAPDGGSNPKGKLPKSPPGATFIRFAPCNSTGATVPMFHSSLWADPKRGKPSNATTAVVVQHGIARNFQVAFSALSPILDLDTTVLVSPNFYLPTDRPHKFKNGTYSNWFNASQTLVWNSFDAWVGGDDPVAPNASTARHPTYEAEGKACSTYDVHDTFFSLFTNRTLYPNLQRIIFSGHSGGGALMSRYAYFSDDLPPESNLTLRFVQANAPNFAYLTEERPNATQIEKCNGWDNWPYGLKGTQPRYVRSKIGNSLGNLYRRYISRDIISLQGNMDTRHWFPVGQYTCEVEAQGGNDRRDRNYAWWVYKNLLAGSPLNVSHYPFYDELHKLIPTRLTLANATLPQGATQQNTAGYTVTGSTAQERSEADVWRHRFCVVDNVGHKAPLMWNSTCGHQAFSVDGIPPDPALASMPPLQPTKFPGAGKPTVSDD